MTIELSAHTRARLQQRGIDEPVIECLLGLGSCPTQTGYAHTRPETQM